MSKLTKNQKLALGKIEAGKAYTLREAAELVKEIGTARGKKIRLTRVLNPFVRLACVLPGKAGGMAGKAFGSLTIDLGLDQGPEGYRKYSFLESIRKSV